MVVLISFIAFCITVVLLFKFILKFNSKKIVTIVFCLAILSALVISIVKPVMHKQFLVNAIEYLIKINDDGSLTTTKQTTTTIIEKKK